MKGVLIMEDLYYVIIYGMIIKGSIVSCQEEEPGFRIVQSN